jgi:hypothetical protein
MNEEILLTPPLLASLLIAGLVIPSMLGLLLFFCCLFYPTFPTPFPDFPDPGILNI